MREERSPWKETEGMALRMHKNEGERKGKSKGEKAERGEKGGKEGWGEV